MTTGDLMWTCPQCGKEMYQNMMGLHGCYMHWTSGGGRGETLSTDTKQILDAIDRLELLIRRMA